MNNNLISRQAAIDALNEYFVRIGKLKRRGLSKGEKAIRLDTVGAINSLPPAQPHTYRGVTLNDVMMYFDSLEGNEDAWTEFCSCFECRGWGLYHIRSATDTNVGATDARQAFMDIVYSELASDPDNNRANRIIYAADEYVEYSLAKQSAQPEQRTGYWYPVGMVEAVGGESAQWGSAIAYHKCSECDGQALRDDFEQEVLSDFCPHCGAKMEGSAE